MYQILQETGLSDDRASEAVSVMRDLQHQSTEHLASKTDLEQLSARLIEKMSSFHQDMTEKTGTYHRNTIIWVVSTVATGVTITVGLISLAFRYL